ncbi:odorant receptor 2a-like [Rhopalosiphum padi]|uniref:odorant receptor 2a-like n=1 Tax=Rhopalosiphum padi TaxID=40932 RepID=UPI00298E6ED5|nr:odorant receptor 2a-like [Rhopalosiphum padi]
MAPFTIVSFQLFLHCYFFGLIYFKKESVTYGMYSCDWTSMDLKFKKLLLLSMRMNDADKLMIKATPTKIINLEFFVKVMITTYNIVSVMVNTFNSKI